MSEKTEPSSGWYPHPDGSGRLRYWNGTEWTEHVAPGVPQQQPSSGPGVWTIARGVALGLAVVIAALIFLGQCAAQNNRDECLRENLDRAEHGQPLLDCTG